MPELETLDDQEIGFIYGLFDPTLPINFRNCRYIGQTITPLRKRVIKHVSDAKCRPSTREHRWIQSLLKRGLRPQIIALVEVAPSAELLDELERRWIAIGRKFGWPLTNHQDGGQNNMATEEARRKSSESHQGRSLSEEHKKKLSVAGRGRVKTPEECANISKGKKGRKTGPQDPATTAKIAAANRNRSPESRARTSESVRRRLSEPGAMEAEIKRLQATLTPEVIKRRNESIKAQHATRDKTEHWCSVCGKGPFAGPTGLGIHQGRSGCKAVLPDQPDS